MRPTARGWGALGVVAFALLMSWQYGPRALNALVVPLVVAVLAAVVAVFRAGTPRVSRRDVSAGHVGDARDVEVDVDVDAPISATVRDAVGEGLSATGNVAETTFAGEDRFSYAVRLDRRGEREIGPLTIVVSDVLGLVRRRFVDEETVSALVYPRLLDVRGRSGRELRLLTETARKDDRAEFTHLREYARGDSLRDVHWKSAAKRVDGELVVKEFAGDDSAGAIEVAATCTPGRADEMAAATASVATSLLESNVDVGVTVPDGACRPGSGPTHRRDVLRLLAVTDGGELQDRERERRRADVLIRTDADGTVVTVDGHDVPFEVLCGTTLAEEFSRGRDRSERTHGRAVGDGETAGDAEVIT